MRTLLILTLLTTVACAQSVGDFIIPYKANAEGPATPKYWTKGNSKLWGTDASGNPQSVNLGTGLSFTGSTLNAAASGGIWGSIEGDITDQDDLQAALDAKLSTATAASTYQPKADPLTTLGNGFGAIFAGSGLVRWNGTTYEISSSVLPSLSGGTGFGLYTEGDMLYGHLGDLAKLAGNTTTTKKFLTQTGTGSASAAPAWGGVTASDITGSISNAQLANSSITINGSAVSLGGSTTIATGLTIGTTTVSGASSGDILINTDRKSVV